MNPNYQVFCMRVKDLLKQSLQQICGFAAFTNIKLTVIQ